MRKVAIIYTTQTGETEKMAAIISDGVKGAGGEAELLVMEDIADVSVLGEYDALAVGSPTQEAKEVPSATDFMDKLAVSDVKGKYAAAFGTYGWSGEAPYILALRLERECDMKMVAEPLKIQQGSLASGMDICRAFGMKLVFGE